MTKNPISGKNSDISERFPKIFICCVNRGATPEFFMTIMLKECLLKGQLG